MTDIKKIEKLIRLTHSENDHEALLALRNAQRLANGDLLSAIAHGPRPPSPPSNHTDEIKTEKNTRFLELLRSIRRKDATITQLREEIAKLKAVIQANK